jgi:N-acetylglucosamine malate deacetylase 2
MKNLVCVFAHPDDEAFGPGGTIAKLSKEFNVYLLCATKGDAGQNSFEKGSVGKIREKELLNSAKILGVKKVYFLGFKDGSLSNNLYHKLAEKVQQKLKELKPEIVITYEPLGVSGHVDHITVSMATMFVAQKLSFIKEVWQYCRLYSNGKQDYFVYFPPGYKKSEIQKVVDVSGVWEKKLEAMRAHKSQIKDFERVLKFLAKEQKKEYFLIKKVH